MKKMNLPAIDVPVDGEDGEVEYLKRQLEKAQADLAEAQKLIQEQGKRINSDLAMKMAIAKLLA